MHSAALSLQSDHLSKELAIEDLKGLEIKKESAGWSISLSLFTELSHLRQKNTLRYWSEINDFPAPSSKIINEILSSVVGARQDASPEIVWQSQCWTRFQNRLYLLNHDNKQFQLKSPINWDLKDCLLLPDNSRLNTRLFIGKGLRQNIDKVEIRYRQGGERCKPEGRGHSSSLKKLLLEYQLPPWLRDRIPLLYVKDQLVAVGNLWVCEGWGVEPEETGIEIYWQVDSL
jgi:tRNA(Ile)-lysidine synthase